MEQKAVFDETWISDSTCVGHNEDDVQPFHDLFLEEKVSEREGERSSDVASAKKYYTNGEMYALLHPGEMDLPYVYDNFEWEHCDVSGVVGPFVFLWCVVFVVMFVPCVWHVLFIVAFFFLFFCSGVVAHQL